MTAEQEDRRDWFKAITAAVVGVALVILLSFSTYLIFQVRHTQTTNAHVLMQLKAQAQDLRTVVRDAAQAGPTLAQGQKALVIQLNEIQATVTSLCRATPGCVPG